MQERHFDRRVYFTELANTSREYFVGYVRKTKPLTPQSKVLEIGCGEGGNLMPFAEIGCEVTGIDINGTKINNARQFFEEHHQSGTFVVSDFMKVQPPSNEMEKYDLVIVNDVFEHIEQPYKLPFLKHMMLFMRTDAVAFLGFPGWQMPFGGHQQMCKGNLSKIPFLHLLPEKQYVRLLAKKGESEGTINELLSIRRSKVTIESFENLIDTLGLKVKDRTMWFINPHYKQKFHLYPVREIWPFTALPYVRNYYTTTVWYLLSLS